jgi:hypothetical protein
MAITHSFVVHLNSSSRDQSLCSVQHVPSLKPELLN